MLCYGVVWDGVSAWWCSVVGCFMIAMVLCCC